MHRFTIARTRSLVAGAILAATAPAASAQGLAGITGNVHHARDMVPLAGAQVSLEGTAIGSLADREGRYLIANVPPGEHVAVVTMIGYATERVSVTLEAGQTRRLDFTLEQAPFALDELIVTGTAGEVRAKELGHAVDVITSRDIESMALRGAEEILAGRAPGVTVSTNSGQQGAGGSVRIRGLTTVSQTVEPLLYIDGVRVFNLPTRTGWDSRTAVNPLQDVAPSDIERIEVIKGPAATTLYGTEAAGGVIQIFTKAGIAGTPIWTAELAMGVNHQGSFLSDAATDPNDLYTRCGNLDTLYSLNVLGESSDPTFGTRTYFFDPTCPADGDWQQNGLTKRGRLSVRGGLGDVTYYLGGNFTDHTGVLPTARSRDGGFRGNFAFEPLPDLSFSLNTAYARRETRWVADGNNADGFLLNVGRGAHNYLQGGKGEDCLDAPAAPDGGERACVTNGYLFDAELQSEVDHFTTGLTTYWNPTDGISNRLVVGLDYTSIHGETVLPFGYLRVENGLFWDESTRHTTMSLDYTGSLRDEIGESWVSTLSWGWQVFKDRHRWTELDVEGFPGPGRPTLPSGAELTFRGEYTVNESSAGVFLQEMMAWRDRLFVIGGLRADGHSSFGDDHGVQLYPKLSASYVASEEGFWPVGWLETLKLRAAVGFSGRAPGPFGRVRTWGAISLEGEPGFTPDEVGFDASHFDGRLAAQATIYRTRTTDALIARTLPPSLGFPTPRTENVGELSRGGVGD